MKANIKIRRSMAMVFLSGLMAEYTKEIGSMEDNMEEVFTFHQME